MIFRLVDLSKSVFLIPKKIYGHFYGKEGVAALV